VDQGAAGGASALVALDPRADLFHELVDAEGAVRFPSVRVHQALALHGAASWSPLLGLEDGRPLLMGRAFQRGGVFVSGLAFSPRWSSLPLEPVFPALAQALALPPASDAGTVRLLAGERVRLGEAGAVQVRAITGSALDWHGQADADRSLPPFPRTGVYAVASEHDQLVVSVRADPGEGRLQVLTGPLVPACAGIPASVATCTGPQALVAAWRSGRSGQDLAPWLVVLAVIAVLLEGLIANTPLIAGPRPASPAAGRGGVRGGAAA
jgi:hypothetical protein